MAMADNAIQGALLTCVVTYLRFPFGISFFGNLMHSFQGARFTSERSLNKTYLISFMHNMSSSFVFEVQNFQYFKLTIMYSTVQCTLLEHRTMQTWIITWIVEYMFQQRQFYSQLLSEKADIDRRWWIASIIDVGRHRVGTMLCSTLTKNPLGHGYQIWALKATGTLHCTLYSKRGYNRCWMIVRSLSETFCSVNKRYMLTILQRRIMGLRQRSGFNIFLSNVQRALFNPICKRLSQNLLPQSAC